MDEHKQIEVLITLTMPDELIKDLQIISPRLNVTVQPAKTPDEIPPEIWKNVSVLYTDNVLPDPKLVPNLRWIQFHWAGIDSLMGAPLLRKEGLLATTLSGSSASQVAEYVLMMLLVLGHRLPAMNVHQKQKKWVKDRWERFSPIELRDSVVGIVGYGSIGRQVAKLLNTFGAMVLATKRDVMHPEDSGYHPEDLGDPTGDLAHRLYPPQALRGMLKECDFVVVTVPLTAETQQMIGAAELAAMKPSAYLIDISRGGVIDQEALITTLKEGNIAGAALDVFAKEPLDPESPLWELPNVIITPHISGVTPHYDRRAMTLFAENMYRYLADLPLYNRVEIERGY